jgi:peptide/nickel transport system ATP-binding protein
VTTASAQPFLEVKDLKVHFPTDDGLVKSVDGINFTLERGKTIGIVGESGSGKSVSSLAVMGLHRRSKARISGQILLEGEDLVTASDARVRELRGNQMAMVFQDPLSALHPYYSIGDQIIEAYRIHHKDVPKARARERAIDMLDRVGIPNAKRRVDQYPHEFSGGMRQRAMIAMSLINDPKLLIADEPTTALDVTVQAQILDLMKDLQREFGSAIIIITHDLGVVADVADDIMVMYAGRAVEKGSVKEVFYQPQHPYTWGLLQSMPRLDKVRKDRLDPIPGNPPSLINMPDGCKFNPRCTYQGEVPGDLCTTTEPDLTEVAAGHSGRCHIDPARRTQIAVELFGQKQRRRTPWTPRLECRTRLPSRRRPFARAPPSCRSPTSRSTSRRRGPASSPGPTPR